MFPHMVQPNFNSPHTFTDPLAINNNLKRGGINVIDLANVDSCAFIATQDMGRYVESGKFEVLGRMDNSDIRGCNLLI